MVSIQKKVLDETSDASNQLEGLWKERRANFSDLKLESLQVLAVRDAIGGVRNNLHNFTALAFVPEQDRNLPPEQLQQKNEDAWRNNQQDPDFHQGFRKYFPRDRVPTSMDMARLGRVFVAESNVLRLTSVSLDLDKLLPPTSDSVAAAYEIVNRKDAPEHSKEVARVLEWILDFRTEEELRSDPHFSIFVSAIKDFLDNLES